MGEVDRDARVDGALLVEKALRSLEREHTLVPDIRVDVEALSAVEPKALEPLWRDLVPWQGERRIERAPLHGKEQLPSVGMVVGVPQKYPTRQLSVVGTREFWRDAKGKDVMAADRLVATIKHVAVPFADEGALRRPALIACIRVDRAPTLCRPANDLDWTRGRIIDEMSVTLKGGARGIHDGHAHCCKARRQVGGEVIDRRSQLRYCLCCLGKSAGPYYMTLKLILTQFHQSTNKEADTQDRCGLVRPGCPRANSLIPHRSTNYAKLPVRRPWRIAVGLTGDDDCRSTTRAARSNNSDGAVANAAAA